MTPETSAEIAAWNTAPSTRRYGDEACEWPCDVEHHTHAWAPDLSPEYSTFGLWPVTHGRGATLRTRPDQPYKIHKSACTCDAYCPCRTDSDDGMAGNTGAKVAGQPVGPAAYEWAQTLGYPWRQWFWGGCERGDRGPHGGTVLIDPRPEPTDGNPYGEDDTWLFEELSGQLQSSGDCPSDEQPAEGNAFEDDALARAWNILAHGDDPTYETVERRLRPWVSEPIDDRKWRLYVGRERNGRVKPLAPVERSGRGRPSATRAEIALRKKWALMTFRMLETARDGGDYEPEITAIAEWLDVPAHAAALEGFDMETFDAFMRL